mmetsp:Transcript_25817/g.83390  ORF Transcript_25817/g.83390 Transcript_25817/m.83390 type:complete len:495 (-) Transcript_25817:520-2004(-)
MRVHSLSHNGRLLDQVAEEEPGAHRQPVQVVLVHQGARAGGRQRGPGSGGLVRPVGVDERGHLRHGGGDLLADEPRGLPQLHLDLLTLARAAVAVGEVEHRLQLGPLDVLAVEVHQADDALHRHVVARQGGVDLAQKVSGRLEKGVRVDGSVPGVEHQVVGPNAALAVRVDELARKVHRGVPVWEDGLRRRGVLCGEHFGRDDHAEDERCQQEADAVLHHPPAVGRPTGQPVGLRLARPRRRLVAGPAVEWQRQAGRSPRGHPEIREGDEQARDDGQVDDDDGQDGDGRRQPGAHHGVDREEAEAQEADSQAQPRRQDGVAAVGRRGEHGRVEVGSAAGGRAELVLEPRQEEEAVVDGAGERDAGEQPGHEVVQRQNPRHAVHDQQRRRHGERDGDQGQQHDAERAEEERQQCGGDRQRQRVDEGSVGLHGDGQVLPHRQVAAEEHLIHDGSRQLQLRQRHHVADGLHVIVKVLRIRHVQVDDHEHARVALGQK